MKEMKSFGTKEHGPLSGITLKVSYIRNTSAKLLGKYEGKYRSYILDRGRNPAHFLDQLELPGDVWNRRFIEKIYRSYIYPLLLSGEKKK
jgi:hypothetical protein